MPKTIPLTKGYMTTVDDDDYEELSSFSWCMTSTGYAKRYVGGGRKHQTFAYMHRQIMGVQGNIQVDHINGNRLDNRRENLRLCAPKDNSRNRKGWDASRKTSRFKGVYWSKDQNGCVSAITVDRNFIQLGCFDDELVAARIYDDACVKHFGKFAKVNTYDELTPIVYNVTSEDHACCALNCERKPCKVKAKFFADDQWWCAYHRPDRVKSNG